LVVYVAVGLVSQAQVFKVDDPLWVDPDCEPIVSPAPVKDISQTVDFLQCTFRNRDTSRAVRAENVNTLGEVPDSSWFTNRMTRRRMTIEELTRGPDTTPGPDASRPWTIIRAKSQGITPGFTIRDSRGDVYFIKFDPLQHPQLATSTEVICTKFFHAFGYHVPENHLSFTRRDSVRVDPAAPFTDENGKKRRMTEADVDAIFARVPAFPDGRVQVVAGFGIKGGNLGPFKYIGTRPDDPNDIFPHENRRELRGLRVFAAWLNHDDSRSINSGDFFVSQGQRGYVKHYLMDFGSCLGSGSVRIQGRRAGNEYKLEWTPILKAAMSLGLWDRPWRRIHYPSYPAIGRFEGDVFEPHRWKPEYPNQAFERMQIEDAFWAAKTVLRFDDDMVRALVKTGQLADPAAESYLVAALIKRRDKIVRYYLQLLNPLDNFEVVSDGGRSELIFRNLGEEAGLAKATGYEYQWHQFDNHTSQRTPIGTAGAAEHTRIQIPADPASFLQVTIRTNSPAQPTARKAVSVYLRNGVQPRIAGVEREP
jgi:hypothetical protein